MSASEPGTEWIATERETHTHKVRPDLITNEEMQLPARIQTHNFRPSVSYYFISRLMNMYSNKILLEQ
jgi:hypothetical protein